METYLGLDLGGTKLLIGEVDGQGNIYNHKRYDSGYFNQQVAFDIIRHSLDDYIHQVGWYKQPPVAMGVGLIGRVDYEQGIWQQIDPERTYPMPLAQQLSETYGMPCFIDNDVKSATRAEMMWGHGRVSRNFLYINVGTGIAAGLVINGQQVRGSHFNAGEVGHVRVGVQVGVKCPCGRVDCVEAIASGMGFDRCARLLQKQYPTALQIPTVNGERVDVRDIFALYGQNDPLCRVLVDNAAEALANLIMNLVRMTDPDTVVLGGGVVADGFMLEHIEHYLHPVTMRFVSNGVVLTKLDPQFAGLLGAAAISMNSK
jgi:predicted NBD/HSP70 family sugar kinase